MTPELKKILIIALSILFNGKIANAQHCKFFEISYKDSLVAKNESNILYNNIIIGNPSPKTIRLQIAIKIPKGWKTLSKDSFSSGKPVVYTLQPHAEKNIALNLLKLPSALAKWDSVKMDIEILDVSHAHPYYLHLRAQADPKFTGQYITENIELAEFPDAVPLSVKIKNTGNIEDTYTIQWQNQYLELDEKYKIKLQPGQDTTYTYMLKIPHNVWGKFRHEDIALCIKGTGMSSYSHLYKLSKPNRIIKETKSPYALLPISLETGIINQSNNINYYGAVSGSIHFADKNELHFSYKSKQFGTEVYGIQQNMYLVDYLYHDWKLSAGMVPSIQRFFISNGRGFSINHIINSNTEVTFATILKDPNFYYTSNNFSVLAKYKIGKYNISQIATTNFDNVNHLNGYVLSNNIQLINNKSTVFSLQGGIGMQQKTLNIPGIEKNTFDVTGGYKYSYLKGHWTFNSNIEYYGKQFPGINNGMFSQTHQLTREFKKKFAGIFYSSSSLNAKYFTDTLYNTDILKFNSERLGLNFGIKDKVHNLMTSIGVMNETGIGSQNDLNKMSFLDINYSYQNGHSLSALLNTQNAFKNNVGADNANVWITTIMASFSYGWPGIMATYTRRPVFSYEGSMQRINNYDETIAGGPFIKYHFFKSKLSGMIKFQVSKSVYDEIVRSSMMGGLSYINDKIGTSVQLSGNIPTSNIITNGHQLPVAEGKFMTLSITKQLNVPIITNRKFYDMKLLLFNDLNNNNRKDANEELLQNQQIYVNNNEVLVTNKNGLAKYLNIPKGDYTLELNTMQSKGLVPANGVIQHASITKNTMIEIPYKKGNTMRGNIKILRDSFSKTVFTADEIKVTATDTSGKSYVTVSDVNGNFTFSLPANIYKVSLNANAFEGSDFIPEKTSFTVNLFKNSDDLLQFIIKQKPRKVRFLEKSK